MLNVDVEVKNDGKSTLGKESNEPGAGGLESMVIEPGVKDYEE